MRACRTFFFISFLLAGNSIAFAQRVTAKPPPDYFVRLNGHRTVFYNDEDVQFSILRRSGKPERAGCSFGSHGEKMQVMKNGKVIREESVGPVEATDLRIIHGVAFQVTRSNFGLYNGREDDVELAGVPTDAYQIRFTCGQEISEPSYPFHFSLWNEPVGGLMVLVRPTKSAFQLNEPITVAVEMRNVGKRSLWCPVPLAHHGRSRNFWRLEPRWDDPEPSFDHKNFVHKNLRMLKPGTSRKAVFLLNHFRGASGNQLVDLGTSPGTYDLWFEVFFHQEDEGVPVKYRKNLWRQELSSNKFRITVR